MLHPPPGPRRPGRAARPLAHAALACLALTAPAAAQDAVWGYRMGGISNDPNRGLDLTAVPDGTGDFYVCGVAQATTDFVFGYGTSSELVVPGTSAGRAEAFLARYRADGTPVWARLGRGDQRDNAEAVSAWPDGSVVTVGRYDRFVGGVPASGITFDGGGGPATDVHIPKLGLNGIEAMFMTRYDALGNLLFARAMLGSGGNGTPNGVATIDLAGAEGYVVVGSFRGGTFGDAADPSPVTLAVPGTSPDGFIARYAANGDVLWALTVGGSSGDKIDDVVVLPNGDMLLVGEVFTAFSDVTFFPGHPASLTLPMGSTEERFVMRLNFAPGSSSLTPDFTVGWLRTFGRRPNGSGTHELTVGPQGDVYVAGEMYPSPSDGTGGYLPTTYNGSPVLAGRGSFHGYVMRIEPGSGAALWARGSTYASTAEAGNLDVAATGDGVFFTQSASINGSLMDAQGTLLAEFGQSTHAKWSRDGELLWARKDTVAPHAVCALGDGAAILTGRAGGNTALDLGEPTEIRLLSPNYGAFVGRIGSGSGPSLLVPAEITRSCDPGSPLATVYFVAAVENAPSGSALEVVDHLSGLVLFTVPDPEQDAAVGPLEFPMGTTALDVRLVDGAGEVLLQEPVLVTIEDRLPPEVTGCAPVTLECAGPETPLLRSMLGIVVSDDCDPNPTLELVPPSVPMGTTVVTAIARDATGNSATCDFQVTVVDTTPPHFDVVPTDVVRECVAGGAQVAFAVVASDACGAVTIECRDQNGAPIDPAGTLFMVGTHVITCTAADPHGNVAIVTFQVTVVDNTDPTLVVPADMTIPNDPGACSGTAIFEVVATDDCDPLIPVVCMAPWGEVHSGEAFPGGATTVTCTASDTSGNVATAEFVINVIDTEPPTLASPSGNSITLATDCSGTALTLDAWSLGLESSDNCGNDVELVITPATIEPGTTTVTCTAIDGSGNTATAVLDVLLLRGPFECAVMRPLDGSVDNRIRPGQVVPVIVRLTCDNTDVAGATVTIDRVDLLDIDGAPVANEPIDDPALGVDSGNLFRVTGDRYHFNLSTAGWSTVSGARHRVTVRVAVPGHVDTLCTVHFVNR